MQFESRETRNLWLSILFSLIPDIAIASVVAIIVSGGLAAFIITLIVLQLLYLFI